jgi:hypothetical protein
MKPFIILTAIVLIHLFGVVNGGAQITSVAATTLSNCQTQVVTLMAYTPGGIAAAASYNLSTNQVVTLNNVGNISGTPSVTFYFSNGKSISYSGTGSGLPLTYTGLTNIATTIGSGAGGAITYVSTFTILTPSTNSITYTPANSVVIPSDAMGNVQIVLQSSSDLVNWVPSLPGTYGSTYTNRFFRVIAVAQ